MFSSLKVVVLSILVSIGAILAGIFTYRGNKIEALEEELVVSDKAAKVASKVVEAEKKAAEFVADNRIAAVEVEVLNDEADKHYNPGDKFYI